MTITSIMTSDAGLYKLKILGSPSSEKIFSTVPVKERETVTLCTGVVNPDDFMIWCFNGTLIAEINGHPTKNCTDDQCKDGDERFRDRLKLDHQTGSLTITNITITDSGLYKLQINSSSCSIIRSFSVTVIVSVMEGDCVTLHTGVKTKQQDRIRWYFNDIRIAQITGDLSKICTDVQCDGKFRDRLELDSQTGYLTITNIMTSDAGLYKLKILGSPSSEKIFNVTVHGEKTLPVKERETVTLCTGVVYPDDVMIWCFNDTLIAEINGHPTKICTDDQCKDSDERFRDRLKLDNQTGSLTITNTRTTDSGLYKLEINSSRFSITRSFSVTVTANSASVRKINYFNIMEAFAVLLHTIKAAQNENSAKQQKKKKTV
uniref:Immunoglobulin domain-containing protein n=1 Tax=Sinocyclocheilus rhinocerous TaxID=307959 RepID=A0A673HPS5_9TELE